MEVKIDFKELISNLTEGHLMHAFFELLERGDEDIVKLMERNTRECLQEIDEVKNGPKP